MDLYERSTRRPGAKVSQRWWEQYGLDLEGVKKKAAAAAAAELYREKKIGEEEGMPLETTTGR